MTTDNCRQRRGLIGTGCFPPLSNACIANHYHEYEIPQSTNSSRPRRVCVCNCYLPRSYIHASVSSIVVVYQFAAPTRDGAASGRRTNADAKEVWFFLVFFPKAQGLEPGRGAGEEKLTIQYKPARCRAPPRHLFCDITITATVFCTCLFL
jgi:hypothetical protein